MAKSKRQQNLTKRLHASGIRKRTARLFAEATDGRRKPAKRVRSVVEEMNRVLADVEDRISGGPAKRKASAKKAVATRKRNAAKRSASAKKAARTRARG
jgi:hypothetical protein